MLLLRGVDRDEGRADLGEEGEGVRSALALDPAAVTQLDRDTSRRRSLDQRRQLLQLVVAGSERRRQLEEE